MARAFAPVLLAAPVLAFGTSAMAQEVRCSTKVDIDGSLTIREDFESRLAQRLDAAGQDPASVCVTILDVLVSSKAVTVSRSTDGRLEETCVPDSTVPGGTVCTWAFTPAEHRIQPGDVIHIQFHGSDFNAGR